ncbi:MAG: glycosyltransferase family 2 protein [Bryobacteraceae bacterium]
MRISVIIPTYNCAPFLGQAIESVLGQTRPVDEILVVDDGSTDETEAVVRSFAPKLRYIQQSNQGVSQARNTAIQEATGDLIAFLDADDWWLPDKIRRQEEAMRGRPDAVLCYTGVLDYLPDGSVRSKPAPDPQRLWPQLRLRQCLGPPSSWVVRKESLVEAGGFRRQMRACEDWELLVRLARRRRLVAVPEPLTCYRIRPASLSQEIETMLRSVEQMLEETLVCDLQGWRRVVWRRRIRAEQWFRMAIVARDTHSKHLAGLLWESFRQWPLPVDRHDRRFKFLAVTLWRALKGAAVLGHGR